MGEVETINSDFNGNGQYGLYAHSMDGDITLAGVEASYNGVKGAYLDAGYTCPGRGLYIIRHLQQGDLPRPLATGPRFVAAINVSVEQDGQPIAVEEEGGYFVVSFKIPEGMENQRFSILFWDPAANNGEGDWVELPPQMVGGPIPLHPNVQDNMLILRGVYQEDGYVRVKVNFTGTFVLVAR
jgi:hypothetical protein